MLNRLLFAALLSSSLSLAAAANTLAYSMSPQRGSASGGTVVTLHGPNAAVTTSVSFGTALVAATRVNATTLTVMTPPQLPGSASRTVPVKFWVFGASVNTGLTFTYDDDDEASFERLLLPVYTLPVKGAFGSEFRTELRATLANGDRAEIYGLARQCVFLCIEQPGDPHVLTKDSPDLDDRQIEPDGKPGQFVYVPREQSGRVAMNLRVFDTSRSAENFGTEIPIVREREFADVRPLVLVGIPTDPRFRNTLRIYSAGDGGFVSLTIQGTGVRVQHTLRLPAQSDTDHPGYIEFSNFPQNAGVVRVTIDGSSLNRTPPLPNVNYWAFVSVTNNATQHITTITPQP